MTSSRYIEIKNHMAEQMVNLMGQMDQKLANTNIELLEKEIASLNEKILILDEKCSNGESEQEGYLNERNAMAEKIGSLMGLIDKRED